MIEARNAVFRLGVIGDLHTYFDAIDVQQINAMEYDLLFFTGDLGGGTRQSSLKMARIMSDLRGPVLVMPGNNDTVDIRELAAELAHRRGLNKVMAIARQTEDSSSISLCGYSHHKIAVTDRSISLIAARPHSMGGPSLTFPDYMGATYAIHSLEDSESRMRLLVDEAERDIIFLAHNGPHGLGANPADIWGCDFKEGGGDWGDTDLASIIDYARSVGKQVLAVVAGHMHLRTRQGEDRPWRVFDEGIDYINAARVPRIFNGSDDVYRHHVCLNIGKSAVEVEEILLPEGG